MYLQGMLVLCTYFLETLCGKKEDFDGHWKLNIGLHRNKINWRLN